MQKKLRTLAKKAGVKFVDIETVYLSKDTKFGKNVIIEKIPRHIQAAGT